MVRPVAQVAARLKEAQKLGFARAFVPETSRGEASDLALALTTVGPLIDLVAQIAPEGGGRRQASRERK
jgi:DNA repair protein RadA/Sms